MPQRELLSREGFRFPTTPKPTRSPGWKLGSGFEGITLESSKCPRPSSIYSRKARRIKSPFLVGPSFAKLELSTKTSPLRRVSNSRSYPERQQRPDILDEFAQPAYVQGDTTATEGVGEGLLGGAAEASKEAVFEHVRSLTALLRQSSEAELQAASASSCGAILKPNQLGENARHFETCHAIRQPSRSERNGWLKRRRVSFALTAAGDTYFENAGSGQYFSGLTGRVTTAISGSLGDEDINSTRCLP